MNQDLKKVVDDFQQEIEETNGLEKLEELRIKYLSKKGIVSSLMSKMKDLSNEERPKFGQDMNLVRQTITNAFSEKQVQFEKEVLMKKLVDEEIDVTLDKTVKLEEMGVKHILSKVTEQIEDICIGLGFEVAEGPEIENDKYNFEKLNIPADHPARDMQDTFYITNKTLLRTHTSPVQIRTMLNSEKNAPLKIICPGKVYRRDDDDATHSHQFMQLEGLYIDKKVSLGDLKGTLEHLIQELFGKERKVRFRSSFFPFTEPSVEVDVSCASCKTSGCSICKGSGWIEVLGAGIVHPNVLKECGYDPKKVQGYAFGIGIERIAMLKYNIDDIRNFYNNDLRFLKQFK